ncbi:MAG: hypothetical protein IBX57_00870 [Gammaproteobacteria bacterium]|nr:hypothetical protein [Gammaproteobacteria bacterium]
MSVDKVKVFDKATNAKILAMVENIDESRWFHISKLQKGRGVVNDTDAYYFKCKDWSIPKELKELLFSLAPKFEPFETSEIVINRYLPGGFIPAHTDKDRYLKNVIVPLQSGDDGITIEDTFYKDEAGIGIVFNGTGPVHEVKKVKDFRYTVIFLIG